MKKILYGNMTYIPKGVYNVYRLHYTKKNVPSDAIFTHFLGNNMYLYDTTKERPATSSDCQQLFINIETDAVAENEYDYLRSQDMYKQTVERLGINTSKLSKVTSPHKYTVCNQTVPTELSSRFLRFNANGDRLDNEEGIIEKINTVLMDYHEHKVTDSYDNPYFIINLKMNVNLNEKRLDILNMMEAYTPNLIMFSCGQTLKIITKEPEEIDELISYTKLLIGAKVTKMDISIDRKYITTTLAQDEMVDMVKEKYGK